MSSLALMLRVANIPIPMGGRGFDDEVEPGGFGNRLRIPRSVQDLFLGVSFHEPLSIAIWVIGLSIHILCWDGGH